jgi:prevent-host-death family protein
MRSLSVREMRAALPRLEQLLAEEGEVVITRNGRPVARVLPTPPLETSHRGRSGAEKCGG